jgi:hypothetical protein
MTLAGDNAGNQLPGTLASPRTGLTPAGCPELIARLHHKLLSCGTRTAGRTAYAEHLVDKIGNCVTAGQRVDERSVPEFCISLRSLSIGHESAAQRTVRVDEPSAATTRPRAAGARCAEHGGSSGGDAQVSATPRSTQQIGDRLHRPMIAGVMVSPEW